MNAKDKEVVVKVVKYKEEFFVWYQTNASGFAQLIDKEGKKYPGTPTPAKLEVVKMIPCIEFNRSWYFRTKIGAFSAVTGGRITHPKILELLGYNNPPQSCEDCRALGVECSEETCDILELREFVAYKNEG